MKLTKHLLVILLSINVLSLMAQEEYHIQPKKKEIGPELIKSVFDGLEQNQIDSTKAIDWIFEFTHQDSARLASILTVYAKYESNIEIDTILIDQSSLEEKYIVDLIEHKIYNQQSLNERVKELNKIFKRTAIELSSLGLIVSNSQVKAQASAAFSESNNITTNEDGLAFSGIVRNAKTSKPIPFVGIGIVNENIGTLSDEQGKFSLQIPKENYSDSLTFSFIGYQTIKKPILQFNENATILLVEEAYILNEVVIDTDRQAKSIILGTRKKGKNYGFIQGKGAGAEAAEKIIPPKSKSIYLNRAEIFINNRAKKPFQFLVNIYEVDSETGLPGKNLLKRPLFLESEIAEGWVGVSMNDQQIIIDQPVFVSFQWISEDSRHPAISLKGRKGYIRSISMGKWIETSDFSWVIKVEGTVLD